MEVLDESLGYIYLPVKAEIVKWKVEVGTIIYDGRIILVYKEIGSTVPLKLKSAKVGKIKKLLVNEGDTVSPELPLLELEIGCTHPTVINDLCAECGADLQKEKCDKQQASVSMIHAIPQLKVSEEQARILGKADEARLLKDRKLVLLVDLDQTLIHTTNDNIPNNFKEVYHFQLYGPKSPWYHTRLRPKTLEFLGRVSEMYELHICTFGSRNYAHMIARFLDPLGRFFSQRILSRDECFDPTSKTANLKALFPCGENLVCIIDDREDVWDYALNLIHVKPYHFFQHTGDIHAPPELSKCENDKSLNSEFTHLAQGITVKQKKVNSKDEGSTDNTAVFDAQILTSSDENSSQSGGKSRNNDYFPEETNAKVVTESSVVQSEETANAQIIRNGQQCVENTNERNTVSNDNFTIDDAENGAELKPSTNNLQENNDERKIIADSAPSKEEDRSNNGDEKTDESSTERSNDNETKLQRKNADEQSSDIISGSDAANVVAVNDDSGGTRVEANEGTELGDEIQPAINGTAEAGLAVTASSIENGKQHEHGNKNGTTDEKSDSSITGGKVVIGGHVVKVQWNSTPSVEEMIELEEEDDYLLYLEDILTRIHEKFYEEYDRCETMPNLKAIIPSLHGNVLKGVNIVFSGIVPSHVKLQDSRAYKVAVSLGAKVTQNIEADTTHMVAVRMGTAKVHAAQKRKNIKIVAPEWLWMSAERWTKVDERLYPVKKAQLSSRHPPAHCSPEHTPPRSPMKQQQSAVPIGKFIEIINPLMTFSSEEISEMASEVDDICKESDSEAENEVSPVKKPPGQLNDNSAVKRCQVTDESDSSSAESLDDGCSNYEKKSFKRRKKDSKNSDDELETLNAKFRRGETLPSDLDLGDSSEQSDDAESDGEWDLIGATLEREFLGNE